MGECAHFCFNSGFIYTHDGASAKFSTNSPETDNSVPAGAVGGWGRVSILWSRHVAIVAFDIATHFRSAFRIRVRMRK
jgi:hypothetical protein